MRREAKENGLKRMFDKASKIVHEVKIKEIPAHVTVNPSLPNLKNLAAQVNAKRKKLREESPACLSGEWQADITSATLSECTSSRQRRPVSPVFFYPEYSPEGKSVLSIDIEKDF